MKRHVLIVVTALSTLPAAVAAQLPRGIDEGWGPLIRVTPFVGWSPGFNSSGNLLVAPSNAPGTFEAATFSFDFASGPASGVNVEVRAFDRISLIGGAAWSSRGHTTFETADSAVVFQDAGSDLYFAKAGGAIRFREIDPDLQLRRLNALVFLAGAVIHERPEVLLFSNSRFTSSRNHWGVNFGLEGELPLANRRFAFHGGLEDFVVFWNESAIEDRLAGSIEADFGPGSVAAADADHSHIWVVRLGFSVRFDR